jgi:hypothetical protein
MTRLLNEPMTRVSIITTINHNCGDDLVREGIIHLLKQALGPIKIKLIHKHLPITTRPEFSWLHSSGVDAKLLRSHPNSVERWTRRIDSLLPIFPWSDKLCNCDVLVQSGAPIYWLSAGYDCAHNEWWFPLIERRWKARAAGRPFLNLAGGACQHWHSDGSEFANRPDVLAYIRQFFDLAKVTTLRDELSAKILGLAGRKAEVLPCTSIFAADQIGVVPLKGEYVVLNYMPGGGHYSFGQQIDAALWEQRFVSFAKAIAARGRCILVCHDQKEIRAAKNLLPGMETFYSDSYADYLRVYAKAHWGLMNRVHGAFALASLGKPAAVIGSDTRAQMASILGLPVVFVNDATPEWLMSQATSLHERKDSFATQMATLKADAKRRYLQSLKAALN